MRAGGEAAAEETTGTEGNDTQRVIAAHTAHTTKHTNNKQGTRTSQHGRHRQWEWERSTTVPWTTMPASLLVDSSLPPLNSSRHRNTWRDTSIVDARTTPAIVRQFLTTRARHEGWIEARSGRVYGMRRSDDDEEQQGQRSAFIVRASTAPPPPESSAKRPRRSTQGDQAGVWRARGGQWPMSAGR